MLSHAGKKKGKMTVTANLAAQIIDFSKTLRNDFKESLYMVSSQSQMLIMH